MGSYVLFTVFSALYLAQALLARVLWAERWFGRAVLAVNQWLGLLLVSAICGAVFALVKMLLFSEGRLATSMTGLAWSGPPHHAGRVFAVCATVALVAGGYLLARAPARSLITDAALFAGPALSWLVLLVLWGSWAFTQLR